MHALSISFFKWFNEIVMPDEITRNQEKKAEFNVVFHDFRFLQFLFISQIRHWERNNYCSEDFFSSENRCRRNKKDKHRQKGMPFSQLLRIFVCLFLVFVHLHHNRRCSIQVFFCLLSLTLFIPFPSLKAYEFSIFLLQHSFVLVFIIFLLIKNYHNEF